MTCQDRRSLNTTTTIIGSYSPLTQLQPQFDDANNIQQTIPTSFPILVKEDSARILSTTTTTSSSCCSSSAEEEEEEEGWYETPKTIQRKMTTAEEVGSSGYCTQIDDDSAVPFAMRFSSLAPFRTFSSTSTSDDEIIEDSLESTNNNKRRIRSCDDGSTNNGPRPNMMERSQCQTNTNEGVDPILERIQDGLNATLPLVVKEAERTDRLVTGIEDVTRILRSIPQDVLLCLFPEAWETAEEQEQEQAAAAAADPMHEICYTLLKAHCLEGNIFHGTVKNMSRKKRRYPVYNEPFIILGSSEQSNLLRKISTLAEYFIGRTEHNWLTFNSDPPPR